MEFDDGFPAGSTPTPTPSATRAREIVRAWMKRVRELAGVHPTVEDWLYDEERAALETAVATALATAEAAGWRAGVEAAADLSRYFAVYGNNAGAPDFDGGWAEAAKEISDAIRALTPPGAA